MTTILVVDDEMPIRRALALNLENRDYEVLLADSGEVALQLMGSEKPDLLLLDLGLPGMDGIAVLHALRGWTGVPIIVLTVRDDARSKIAALDAGADDYVTKPFSMGELTARIRAALRRTAPPVDGSTEIVTRSFRLDLDAHRAHRVDAEPAAEVRLTPTEWAIVAFLVRHPGMLVTRRQLVDGVWGPTADPGPTLLRVHMANIRRKLEAVPSRPEHFLTDSGVGYRFEPAADV